MPTWKLRITVLWVILAVNSAAALPLAMFGPGVSRDLMAGEWMGMNAHRASVQISWAVNWLLPLTMAFLTLVLRGAVNRWTNAVVGAIFASGAISTVGVASGGIPFLALFSAVGALLIVWHTWKWPRAVHGDPTGTRG